MKRVIVLVLCILSVVSAIPFAASASSFSDVADGKWYSEGIEFCYQNGYMAGVSEGVFDRNGTLTRAMFVTILASLDKADTSNYADAAHFTDVKPGKWYSGAVNWAFENALASGIGEGQFGYKNPVTREQIAVFMLAYAEFSNKNHPERNPFDVSAREELTAFDDASRIHDWALDGISWAVASGLIGGTSDTTLDPRGFCTRAQAAVIIHSFMRDIEKKECEHVWVAPDCTNEGYCSVCNEKGEAALGHIWVDPDCENDGYCSRCNEKGEPALGHVWVAPDCSSDGYCSVCGEKSGSAVGHDWIAPDCVSAAYCSVCGASGDPALGHDWVAPDCVSDAYCSVCGASGDPALGHDWIAADCISDGYCSRCNEKSGSAIGHDWVAPDCLNDGYCSRCNEKGEAATGHDFIAPDCLNAGYCSRCNEKGEAATGHNYLADEDDTYFNTCEFCGDIICAGEHRWIDATCTKDGYCALCKEFYESAKGHKMDEYGTCIRCGGEYDPIAGCFHEWVMPDCLNDGYCAVCGMAGEKSDGHDFENGECNACGLLLCKHNWVEATCAKPIHCSLCGENDPASKALGHDYSSGNIGCKRCGAYHNPQMSMFANLLHNLTARGTDLSNNRRGFSSYRNNGLTRTTSSLCVVGSDYTTVFSTHDVYTVRTRALLSVTLEISDKAEGFKLKIESSTKDVTDFSMEANLSPENGVSITDVGFSGGHSNNELLEIAESAAALIVDSTESILGVYTNLDLSDLA